MLTINPELQTLLNAATSKINWFSIFESALTSRRVVCTHNGTTFIDCALSGSMTFSASAVTGIGATSNAQYHTAVDLSSGTNILKITGGGHWVQGTLGLSGSGCDFIISGNPTATSGFAVSSLTIAAPTGLPSGLVDTTPPTVSISVGATNVTSAGGLLLTATASDNVGVDHVEFYRGASLLGTVYIAPFTFTNTLSSADNGSYTYTAKAFDAAGNNTTSSSSPTVTVSIGVDTTPPTVSVSVAATNIVTAGGLLLTATASDNVGVDHVEFYRGATFLGTKYSSPWTFTDNLNSSNNGSYTYTAKAYDAAANSSTSSPSSTVVVNIPAPTGVLATMTVQNTSATPVSSDFIPPMFGHPFKKGDIPSGYYPRFELADTTNIPYTMFNKTTWSDGSLKFASFLIRIPTTVAGSSTIPVSVKNTTTAPASSSSRSTADLSSGSTDLKVSVDGLDNLSGTWISSLNQGVIDNDDIIVYGDGAVGKVWRIRQQFMQAGANHGQLECYWYVAALQDSSGGLYGLRYLGRVGQPWYNIDSPTKNYRAFSSFRLMNGASQVRDCWANHGSNINFTYTSGNSVTATAHGLETGYLVRAFGTLPTGLSTGTSYFVNAGLVATGLTPNTLSFNTDSSSVVAGSNVALSGTASGASVKAYPYITHFGSLWTCGASSKWDYIQAGGSVSADATTRITHDRTYWKSTGVIPAYDLTVTPASQTSYSYELNTMGPINRSFGLTGERSDIGLLPDWMVKHILSQSANDEQVTRLVGLAGGHLSVQLYNATTKTIPTVNAGTYSGMPTADQNFRWRGTGSSTQGFTNPTSTFLAGVDELDDDHTPCLFYYPYVLTGEPQFLDMVIEMGNHAVQHRYQVGTAATSVDLHGSRNLLVNGTHYYGTTVGDENAQREDAWSTRDMGFAAGIVPDSSPQCAAYKTYFNDMLSATFAALVNYNTNVATPFWRTMGLMHFKQAEAHISDSWQHGYWMMANAQVAKLTENADALTELTHVCKYHKTIKDSVGTWHVPAYNIAVRTSDASDSTFITSAAQLTYYGANPSWTAGNQTFTFNSPPGGYAPTNGDIMLWDNVNGTPPTGFTAFVQYYFVSVSGNTFKLAATLGGSPITPTNSGSNTAFFVSTTPPSTNCIQGFINDTSYAANILGACKLAKAAGAVVDQTLIDDLTTRTAGVDYSNSPKYKFTDTY